MKKVIFLVAIVIFAFSCATPREVTQQQPNTRIPRFVSTAKNIPVRVHEAVNTPPLLADLKVLESKINYTYVPSKAAQAEGEENCIKCAIREALKIHGDADVIIGLDTQTKFDGTFYNGKAVVESVTISGYPAKYVNFRHPQQDYWKNGEYLLPSDLRAPKPAKEKEKEPTDNYNIELQEDGAGVAEVKFPLPFSFKKNKDKSKK